MIKRKEMEAVKAFISIRMNVEGRKEEVDEKRNDYKRLSMI